MAQEDDRDDNPEQQESAPGRRKKWWIVGIVGAVLVLLSVTITLFLIGLIDTPEDAETAETTDTIVTPAQPAIYYPLRPSFVTNYDVRSRQRFLQVDITLMLRDANLVAAIELHMPAIRNSLVMLFSGQLYEELQTPEGKELLRQQALFAVQDVLQREVGSADIEQVLFTSFVMQ